VSKPAADARERPAFYATGRGTGGWRDWLSILHPPYTAWHLSYVVIGAALTSSVDYATLGWSLLAFFLALGLGAHALDELHGHPLRTGIADRALLSIAVVTIAGACAIGWTVGGLKLLPFIAVGAVLAFGYNLEWFGGSLHNAAGFSFAWGAFPLLTSYYVQAWNISWAAVFAAFGAVGLTLAQRSLSTPARWLRRRVTAVQATATLDDGSTARLATSDLLRPLEITLKALSFGVVTLAVALLVAAR
jgi:hypothetical protein